MRCPACKSELVVVEREEIELDWCISCRGLWFDGGELELLGEKAGRTLDVEDLGRRATSVARGTRRCPRCPRRMEVLALPLPAEASILIDRCPLHGFWLDRGELGTLLHRLGDKRETDGDLVFEFLGETFHGSAVAPPQDERRDR
jgi:Zn-finger nucleic acid-binding protein